jgi:hypothetical protein
MVTPDWEEANSGAMPADSLSDASRRGAGVLHIDLEQIPISFN